MRPKVSIIIPVYRVQENFLIKCIKSCCSQTLQEIEILLIDDGSPDNSGIICDAFAKKDERIHVIHQYNKGVSGARNTGIRFCHGKYITFLDADDWIEKNTLACTFSRAEQWNCDLLGWNHFYNYKKKEVKRASVTPKYIEYNADNMQNLVYDMVSPEYDKRYNHKSLAAVRGVWGKLYRSDIIHANNIKFENALKIGEDACFNIDFLNYADKAVFINMYFNHYRVNLQSENRRYRRDIGDIRLELLKQYCHRLNIKSDPSAATCYIRETISCIGNCLKKYVCSKSNHSTYHERISYLKKLTDSPYLDIGKLTCDKTFFTVPEKMMITLIQNKANTILLILGYFM